MSNDVVMVAIPKELRDRICFLLDTHSHPENRTEEEALRAAPETVSLEGVERWVNAWEHEGDVHFDGMRHDDAGAWVKFSDLRHLAPVQPSAVVSREGLEKDIYHVRNIVSSVRHALSEKRLDSEAQALNLQIAELLRIAEALQLPQPVAHGPTMIFSKSVPLEFIPYEDHGGPVAPVQSGGGYVEELKSAGVEALREIGRLKVERQALINGGNSLLKERDEAIKIANNILYEFEARDQQHDSTVVDSYAFLVGRDWEPFLDRIKWEEPDESLTTMQSPAEANP
jgi:hypothetical protein